MRTTRRAQDDGCYSCVRDIACDYQIPTGNVVYA